MAIVLTDPRYQALDQVGLSFGKYLGDQWEKKRADNATQKFLADQAASAQQANEAQGLLGSFQKKYGYRNEYEGIKKDYEVPGLTDAQRIEIVDKSKNLRQRALADGIELPGEELNYNDLRISNDDFARSNIGQIASQMGKTGLYGPALAKIQADLSPGIGAGVRPELPQGLLSSIKGLIDSQAAKYSDPRQLEADNAAFLAKHSFSPEQAKRVETMLQPRVTDAKSNRNAQLLSVLYNPNAADADKIQAAQEYYQVNGLKLDGILEKLAPGRKTFTEDTGANINTVSLQTPNALGIGPTDAKVLRTTKKELGPRDLQQDKQFNQSLAQDLFKFQTNLTQQQNQFAETVRMNNVRIEQSGLSNAANFINADYGMAKNMLDHALTIAKTKAQSNPSYDPSQDEEYQDALAGYRAMTKRAESGRAALMQKLGGGQAQGGAGGKEVSANVLPEHISRYQKMMQEKYGRNVSNEEAERALRGWYTYK